MKSLVYVTFLSAVARIAAATPLKVFVLAGQSNVRALLIPFVRSFRNLSFLTEGLVLLKS
jgi:hypothetical protein